MSQITGPLSINNGAASPVAKSFAPVSIMPSSSKFSEKTAASSAGFLNLTIGFSEASGNRKTNRIDITFDMPILETVSGETKVTRSGLFKGYFVVPDTFTAAERADLIAFVANALDNAQIRAVVKDLDPLY